MSISASYPATADRLTRSSPASRSFHTYSWNHFRASGAAAATSSIDVVPIVDSAYGIPICSATLTTALSPSWFIIRVNPVGANANGSSERPPRIDVPRSISETSRRIDGCSSISANSRRARLRLISASAAPSV